MAKSKRSLAYGLSGKLDLANGTVTEETKEGEFVYDFNEIIAQFDGKEVTISIKESSELESVE